MRPFLILALLVALPMQAFAGLAVEEYARGQGRIVAGKPAPASEFARPATGGEVGAKLVVRDGGFGPFGGAAALASDLRSIPFSIQVPQPTIERLHHAPVAPHAERLPYYSLAPPVIR